MILDCESGSSDSTSDSEDDCESVPSSEADECEASFAVVEEYHKDVKGVLPN